MDHHHHPERAYHLLECTGRDQKDDIGQPRSGQRYAIEARKRGPIRGAKDAPPQSTRQHPAGDIRKEVGRGPEVGGREDQWKEVSNAKNPAPKRRGGWESETAGRKIPLAPNRALPHRTVPEVDKERKLGRVRAVSLQDTGHRRESTCSRTASDGKCSGIPCGRR